MTTVHIATAAGRSVSWKVPDSGAPFAVQRIPSLVQVAAPAAAPTSAAAKNHDGAADNDPPSVAICNVHDYQRLARSWLSKPLYEYLASGTDDEQTLSQNIDAFKQYFLRPRVMRPVGSISTVTRLFGRTLSSPVFVSPAGVHALCEPREGECATARACARVGTLFGLSQHSTRTIEEVADAVVSSTSDGNANLWYQAYILKDRALTLRLVRRAVQRGYRGIFLTVDSARFGYREADARNGWDALPEPHRLVNYDEVEPTDGGGAMNRGAASNGAMDQTYNARDHASWDQNSERMFDTDATWADVSWLKKAAGCGPDLPLVVKGIMTSEDALLALDAGADGIMVSNHGGRGLDGALASIDALPDIVRAVRGAGWSTAPILLDGGIRRGSDVVKALALGATAVGVGKPVFFSLAVGGEEAVVNMLGILRRETEACMAICGAAKVEDITGRLVTRHPSGGPAVPYIRAKL